MKTHVVNNGDCDCDLCRKVTAALANNDAQARRLALGRVAYETFAEQRIAAAQGKPVSMPPWQAPVSTAFQLSTTPPLPDAEHEIWAKVAEAVAAAIPFVITDEIRAAYLDGWSASGCNIRAGLRAAALVAGFRVEER